MAKFKFRLATLLKLREAARDERRGQLAQAHQADEIIAEQQRHVQRDLDDNLKHSLHACSPGAIDVDRLLEARRYELVLRVNQQQIRQQREAVQAEIQRRREAVVEANRQVRVLEELRRKQRERHREEENRRQANEMDETAQRCVQRENAS